jgi:uncharacterized repeat protein (TIGR01451 family)
MYVRPGDGSVRLSWVVGIYTLDAQHYWQVAVDAATGEVVSVEDLVEHDHWGDASMVNLAPLSGYSQQPSIVEAHQIRAGQWVAPSFTGVADGSSYRVYGPWIESPIHTNPVPPADGRALLAQPAHPVASPFGWHDTDGAPGPEFTITRGNNVHAYLDRTASNTPDPGLDTDGGPSLTFDFPLDLTLDPHAYGDAAVTNLFYWNNIIHDVAYQYGFTEVAGNFQVNNYGRGGLGNDDVRAEAQDGGGTNNANFFTPVDGSRPRMQMYLWTTANPRLDGDLDAGIIVHEYAHGISYRLTGGPSTLCLSGQEQMGEGWSDYLGLVFTDLNVEDRGIGTYALNQPVSGQGIRPARYSRNFAINNYTYDAIKTLPVPHGVGFVWATMLWDMTRDLVDEHGFNPDVYGPWNSGGNNLAVQLVMDGMKLQPCNPGFVDGRNAILAAEMNLTGGANQCTVWNAFARRGLGYSAVQGTSASRLDNSEAFDLPPSCTLSVAKAADPSPVNDLGVVSYTLTATNSTEETVTGVVIEDTLPENGVYMAGSASDGGVFSAGKLMWPAISLAAGESVVRTYQVQANAGGGSAVVFEDDMESGDGNWSVSNGQGGRDWALTNAQANSPTTSWFGQNVAFITDQYLATSEAFEVDEEWVLRFWHRHNLETGFDGGVIEISADGGGSWADLGPAIVQNGYTHTISVNFGNPIGGRQAFSGNSGSFKETIVDLSGYAGQTVVIRFRLGTDNSVSADGWYVDDVLIGREVNLTNVACISSDTLPTACTTLVTRVEPAATPPVIEVAEKAAVLWPVNHLYRTLTVADFVTAVMSETDPSVSIDDVVITHVTSDEPENSGTADGNTLNDMVIAGDCRTVQLRAERHVRRNGRVYRIHVALTDAHGATGVASFPVGVPLSQRPGQEAVEDTPEYTVSGACALLAGAGAPPVTFEVHETAGREAHPTELALASAFPNPFAGRATLAYEVPVATHVRLAVYDVLGREVARLVDAPSEPGRFTAMLDGDGLASGTYVVRLSAGDGSVRTTRITLVK